MNQTSRSVATLEYLRYQVTATVDGATHDPTGDVVQFAFETNPSTPPTTWYAASWETTTSGSYVAKCLVGPAGTFVPQAGITYYVWVKITDNPEVPVQLVGTLSVY